MADDEAYAGARLGLPETGRGSLAGWGARLAALAIDWGACMIVAIGVFGTEVITGQRWQRWTILTLFWIESSVLCWLASGSFGQLVARIGVVRLDRQPLGLPRSILRAALVSLALPALIVGVDRRGLQDLAAGTIVVRRR